MKRPADVERAKNDDNTIVGEESEIKPLHTAATEKGNILMNITMTRKGQ